MQLNIFKTNYLNHKISLDKIKFFLFYAAIFVLLIFPKINIVDIPGFYQGVRIEDILVLFYALVIISNFNYKVYKNSVGINFLLFFPYFVFTLILSYLIGVTFENDQYGGLDLPYKRHWIFIFRYIEYIILIALIIDAKPSKQFILNLAKFFLALNLLVVLLQSQQLFPVFSSRGILMPQDFGTVQWYQTQEPGLLGGPWELSFVSIACFFIVNLLEDKKLYKIIFFLITFLLLFLSETRGNIVAFVISLFFLNRSFKLFLIILLLTLFAVIVATKVDFNIINKLSHINIKVLFELLWNFLVYQDIPSATEAYSLDYHRSYVSFYYRLVWWEKFYVLYLSHPLYILFGTNMMTLYMESLIFRCLFSFGLVGVCFIFYLARHVPLYFFVCILIAGLTIDLFISFKIFLASYLLVYSHHTFKIKQRN